MSGDFLNVISALDNTSIEVFFAHTLQMNLRACPDFLWIRIMTLVLGGNDEFLYIFFRIAS